MPMKSDIAALHRAYTDATGLDIALTMDRERAWFEWMRYRSDDPFKADDLRLVVRHLQRGIREQQRNPGCLRFRNLIEMVDSFDEERALARKAMAYEAKPRPPATVTVTTNGTSRVQPNTNTNDTSKPVGASVDELIRQMRMAVQ
jgi:hypothetical protein